MPGEGREQKLKRQMVEVFSEPIVGDIFGSSDTMLGMLYRSRVQESIHLNKEKEADTETKASEKDKKELGSSLASVDMFDRDSDSEDERMESMNPRQQLATTVKNWSTQAENDQYIINEGAVHALIALAAMDDGLTKKCCAFALYHLSSRSQNREALLQLGAATGIITISMQVKSWKIAKTCAQTLANLSMHLGGETSMAKDGAILASVILLGLKGNRLLPISMQALYNLTCSKDYYKGMERIVKAFLSLPALPPALTQSNSIFDTTLLFLKALRNSARFSWIRTRLVEDGVVQAMVLIAASLTTREKGIEEIVTLVVENLRLLSDSAAVRPDMIQKGALDVMQQCQPHCSDDSRLVLSKALYNLSGSLSSLLAFEQASYIVAASATSTYHPTILQYSSACIALYAADGCMRGRPALINLMVQLMPGLLQNHEPLTQFFCVKATGNLMFGEAFEGQEGREALIISLINAGEGVIDPDAVTALTTAVARLSQDPYSIGILEKHALLETVLDMLLRLVRQHDNMVVQETCCVALSRISLLLSEASLTTHRRAAIAEVLFNQLNIQDLHILSNTMSAIRALGEKNMCNEDLLGRPTLTRIASIIANYGNDDMELCRISCAVLAAFSYDVAAHVALTESAVLDVIFATTKSEDSVTREMVATTICNMSVDELACRKMIEKGVVEVLATLSGATSEIIQELCAKCFCNLTCTVDMHSTMIQNKVLQTILMIALVRSVASKTKQLCARALLNLISEENIAALKEAGATRVFAAISSSPHAMVQHICAQGFLLFSSTANRRDDLVTRRPVLQSLFNMVRCTSARSRVLVGMTICNLLACPASQKSAIHGGALSVFKLIATQDFEELKEASARTIISLGQSPSVFFHMTQHPLVPLLVMILHSSRSFTFECTVCALACLAHSQIFRTQMINEGAVAGIVEAILTGRINTIKSASEAIRCIYFLSYVQEKMEYMTVKCHILLALHVLYKSSLLTVESAQMVALIIRNASEHRVAIPFIVSEGAFLLLRSLLHCLPHKSIAISRSVIVTVLNLAKNSAVHESIVEQGCITMFRSIVLDEAEVLIPECLVNASLLELAGSAPHVPLALTNLDSLRMAAAIRQISASVACREVMAMGRVVDIFRHCRDNNILDEDSRGEVAGALQNIASSKSCVALLVAQQAAEMLLSISKEAHSMDTKSACSTALGQISESTKVKEGTVASLLVLTLEKEDELEGTKSEVASALRLGIRASSMTAADTSMVNAVGTGHSIVDSSSSSSSRTAMKASGGAVRSLRTMIRDGIATGKVNMALQTMPEEASAPAPKQQDSKPMDSAGTTGIESDDMHHDAAEGGAGSYKKPGSLKNILGSSGSKFMDAVKKLTAFDMSSVESITRELEVFCKTYDDVAYSNFSLEVRVESGGVVNKKATDASLTLPTLNPQGLPERDRSAELTKLSFSMDPRPKDMRIINTFVSPIALSKEYEARETQPAVQDEDGAYPPTRRNSTRSNTELSHTARRKNSLLMHLDMMQSISLLQPAPVAPVAVAAVAPSGEEAKLGEEEQKMSKAIGKAGSQRHSPPPAGAGAAWAGMDMSSSSSPKFTNHRK